VYILISNQRYGIYGSVSWDCEYTVVNARSFKTVKQKHEKNRPRKHGCATVSPYRSSFKMDPSDTLPLVISIIGTVTSFAMQLSPIPVIMEIVRSKDVGYFRSDPFIIGICFALVNGAYSIYSSQLVSAISCGIGLALYSIYLIFFSIHSKSKRALMKKLVIFLLVCGFLTAIGPVVFILVDKSESGHTWLEDRGGLDQFIDTWLGVCATLSIIMLFSGQLTNIAEVIKNKDARSISTSMAIGGLVCSITWAVYAGLIVNAYYIVSNGIGVLSGILQLSLKRAYPTTGVPASGTEAVLTADDDIEMPLSPDQPTISLEDEHQQK